MAPPVVKFDSESILALGEFVSPTNAIVDKPQLKDQQLIVVSEKKKAEPTDDDYPQRHALSIEVLAKEKILSIDQARVDQGNMHMARIIAAERMKQKKNEAFLVFNVDTVVKRFIQWYENMPRVKPFYAVKCNNDRVLLATLAKLGAGFDCASREEIDLIFGGGFAQCDNIVYANTCKSPQFIRHAVTHGINRFTFDCMEELAKMKREHKSAKMILRIDVSDPSAKRPLDMKFGCNPVMDAPRLLLGAKQMEMQIVGISFHVGSGCQNPLVYREAIAMARKLFKLGEQLGHEMCVLDLGGGFPGCAEELEFFDQICNVINEALDEFFPDDVEDSGNDSDPSENAISREQVEIIAEPGRYFASSPTSVCANVIGATCVPAQKLTKKADDEQTQAYMYYLDDGVYGSFSCISSRLYTKVPNGIPLFHRVKENEKFLSVVWGPTCDTRDQVEELCLKTRLLPGDWLYYSDMGAYTRVTATGFNGFNRPTDVYYVVGNQTWDALNGKHHHHHNTEVNV